MICPTCTDLFCHCARVAPSIASLNRLESTRPECITASIPRGPLCVLLSAIALMFVAAFASIALLTYAI